MKRIFSAVGLTLFVAAVPLGLLATVGGPFVPDVDIGNALEAVQGSYLAVESILRALGLLCWGLWFYLLIVVTLRVSAGLLMRRGSPAGETLMLISGAVTPRFIRKLIDVALGGALLVSSLSVAHAAALPIRQSLVVHSAGLQSESSPSTDRGEWKYVVRPGDSLWEIAEEQLGSGYRWREVYELNRGRTFPDGRSLTNPRLIHPGWVLELPEGQAAAPIPAQATIQQPSEPAMVDPTVTPTSTPTDRKTTREIEHDRRSPESAQSPVIEVPSGSLLAASFASGLLAARALGALRRRRSRKALADPAEIHEPGLMIDIRRKVQTPAAGHLEAAALEVTGLWQRVYPTLPRILSAVEDSERAVFHLAKPNSDSFALPPSSTRIVFREEGDIVRAEVRRPFPPKMVRAESPIETGLLTPLGAFGKDRSVHIGLLGLGGIAVSGEGAATFTAQTLLACAADTAADDLEILLIDASEISPTERLNHVRASVGWDGAPEILNRIQAELLARARAFMSQGVEDFWSFLGLRLDERMPAILVVASEPPPALKGVVEALASQLCSLGGAFISLGWSPLGKPFAVSVDSKIVVGSPLPYLPDTLKPFNLSLHEMEGAIEVINAARPPAWDMPEPSEEPQSAEKLIVLEDETSSLVSEKDASRAQIVEEDKSAAPPRSSVDVEAEPMSLRQKIGAVPRQGQLEVRSFGNLFVIKDGRVIEKGFRTSSRELLAFLLTNPQGITKDRIIEAIWPDLNAESAAVEVDRAVYYLRSRTGSGRNDHVEHPRDDFYRLDLGHWWTDVSAFESLLSKSGTLAAEEAITALSSALDLYQGPFCDDCYYSWLDGPRERYRALFVKSSARLANLMMEYGQPEDAIAVLDRAIEVDPINEDLYRRAISIEGRIGRRKAVVTRFSKLEAVLQDELDVDPDEETAALFRQIMREIERTHRTLKS
jgi:DNA-binding SARP family transcriptional activator